MLLPKGVNAKVLRDRIPSMANVFSFFCRARVLFLLVISIIVIAVWRGASSVAASSSSFLCFGPGQSPLDISRNDHAAWYQKQQTPVIYNHHKPIEVNATNWNVYNLNDVKSTEKGAQNKEKVLILTPLRDASQHLAKYFELLVKLTYPHDLIDVAFLVSDSKDDTLALLSKELERIQNKPDPKHGGPFRSVTIIQKDFGIEVSQDVQYRHSFAYQGPRRKALGAARNFLLYSALKPDHSWVHWRDVDIEDAPPNIIQDFIAHDKDIIVPNIWFHRYRDGRDVEGRFDYNSWQESAKGLKLAASLPKDTVLAEGYDEFDTGRTYLVKMGDWRKNKDVEVPLDGIGGVAILVKADIHRQGINFPSYAFENQAETEGFAKMAKRAGKQVIGLPNYVVWHVDTAEKGHLKNRPAY
ncbi:hypothetical protein EX30DRAFT_307675 [Ascodesmis nigricans]|uniref:Mannan polymerase II complex ANP1 subunit n=1 Tax=Ascodesmis nigricans TaxID=341454 RepID=A0A4V3SIK0_9PEZI|nr:hypothetical protein EX30DRAFT_307675 [Ascodesmis nigricans]